MNEKKKAKQHKRDGKTAPVHNSSLTTHHSPLVPRLRFPEFRDAGAWEKVKLIDTADKSIRWSFVGGPFGSNLKSSDYVENGIRVIQLQNIGDAEFIDEYKIFTSEEKADELLSNNIYPGDIILSKMGDPVGRACLIPKGSSRYVMCSDGIRLAVDEKRFSKYFLFSSINSVQFRSLVEKTASGSTRKRIGIDELKNLPLLVPSPSEQQKIADFLSSLDELIELEARQCEALRQHKKGLMQQMFPNCEWLMMNGERNKSTCNSPFTTHHSSLVPRLRFPEFRDAGAWEAKRLGELTNRITERIDSKKLTPVSITSGAGFVSQAEKFGRDISGRQYEKYIVLKEGQFSYNKGNSKTFPQGAIYQLREFKEAAVPNAFYSFEFKDDYVPEFFRGYFEKNFHGHQLVRFITSGARSDGLLNIGANDFFSIVLPTPRSRAEQQKIADCLSSLDELIELQSQKVEALKQHKKGLMQQMFPNGEL